VVAFNIDMRLDCIWFRGFAEKGTRPVLLLSGEYEKWRRKINENKD